MFQTDENIVGLVWFIKQGLIFLSYVHQKSEVRQQDEKKEVSDRVKLIDIDTIKAPTIAVRAFKVLQTSDLTLIDLRFWYYLWYCF